MKNLKSLLYTPLLIVFFFMFLGFLESSLEGLISASLLSCLSYLFLPLALIPFIGLISWILFYNFFSSFLISLVSMPVTNLGIYTFGIILASLINIPLTILTVVLLWKFLTRKNNPTDNPKTSEKKFNLDLDIQKIINSLKSIEDISNLINYVLEKLTEFWERIDKRFLGSAIFWFGLGVSTHDFLWETEEPSVNARRTTHGFWMGLEMAWFGLDMITSHMSLSEKIKKNLYFFVGFGMASLGFILLEFLPKGIGRIISHFFFWSGLTLMIYNWYELVKTQLLS